MNIFEVILTLFLVQDPIGNIPICLSLLKNVPKQRHIWIIIRENLIALLISSVFLLSGKTLLNHLHITTSGLGIAGGFILLIVAYQMIFPDSTSTQSSQSPQQEPLIVPLAIPLLAGPSMMATLMLYSSQYSSNMALCFLALLIITGLSTAILLLALPLYQWLGAQLLKALERLMGVILIAMATQMILDHVSAHFK